MSRKTHTAMLRPSLPPRDLARPNFAQDKEQRLESIWSNPDLPTPPAITLQVIDLASKPDCSLSSLAALISQDPALCAKILRTVNSALFGLRQPVSSISAAIRCLGMNPLRSLVLTLTLPSMQRKTLPREGLQAYWRVSVAGGLAARALAVRFGRSSPDTDLVAGLMRDLGMLVLYQLFPKEYQLVLDTSPDILASFQCELEEQLLQVNHAEVSAELLRDWRLPDNVTEPIRWHHQWVGLEQMQGDLGDRTRLLYFASQIGHLQLSGNRPALVRELLTLADEHFGMNEKELRNFLEPLQAQMEDFAAILQVDLGDAVAYGEVLTRGVEELTRLAVQASAAPPQAIDAPAPSWDKTAVVPQAQGLGRAFARDYVAEAAPAPRPLVPTLNQRAAPRRNGPAAVGDADLEKLLMRLFPCQRKPGMLGTLDGYEVLELIGRGGMGAVFRAVDPRLQRVVAIKTLLPDLADSEFDRRCFIQEGRAVAALNHQNIVSVYALGEQAGISYLVMEYIRGTSLANRLLQQAPLPLADVIQVGLQTAAGLSVAHEQGLVHRDIKPANLLVEEKTQRIKIVDFGLALAIGQGQPGHTEGLVGTPYFMSPEQARSQPTDPRTDLFSLGSVLYTASTGRLPFDGDKLDTILDAIRNVNPPPVRQLNPAIPAWLDEIITQLLAKDRARRFPSAADLKRLLVFHLAKLQAARGQSPAK